MFACLLPIALAYALAYASAFFTSTFTMSEQIQTMMIDLKIQQIAHGRFNLLDPGITKLEDFAAIKTDEMIMLLEAM